MSANLVSVYYVSGTVITALCELFHLTIFTTLWGDGFIDEEIETDSLSNLSMRHN